jgi:putative DNA primase/helicase
VYRFRLFTQASRCLHRILDGSHVITPGNIPRELRDRDQWVVWRSEERGGKATKVPYAVGGGHARANDPKTWASFSEAVQVAGDGYDGVGYTFAADDPYCGIDLDDVRDKETGELHEEARSIIDRLNSYAEISPSEEGVKIIVRASKPGDRFRTGKTPWHGDIELYDRERYFTITGYVLGEQMEIREAQADLDAIYAERFDSANEAVPPTAESGESRKPDSEDEEVLERAKDRRHFRALWDGDTSRYPSGSEADLAFCSTLAQLTDDRDQVLRLWQSSALWREKCDDRPDYVRATVERAFFETRPDFADLDKLNDLGNARRLVSEHGHDLLFASAFGWLTWDGTRWKQDATGEAERRVKASAERLLKSIPKMNLTDDGYRKRLTQFASGSMQANKLAATLTVAETEKQIRRAADVFDKRPYVLNVLNGMLDLRTGELNDHDRSALITSLAPVEYDPDAQSDIWDSFLSRILPDVELREFVQRCAGYSIAGHPVEKALIFAHGPQDTGKSTFLDALEHVLGDYAQTADFETFLHKKGGHGVRNDIARMRGVRLIKSLEVDEGEKMATGVVKAMTGGDTIAARHLFKEFFEFKIEGVLWLAANARPKVDANDAAMWRRILHTPFLESIPKAEQDKKLGEKLRRPEEQRAILAWLVAGYVSYVERGLDVPAVVEAYTEEYRHEMNTLADFYETRVEVGVSSFLSFPEVKELVQRWADDERRLCPSDPEIKASLRAAGCRDERRYIDGTRRRVWVGIREASE